MTESRKAPFSMDVLKGETKAFCMCGLSKAAPLCDGSHRTSSVRPEVVQFDADKTIYACGCGTSSKKPYCDGSHKSL